MNPIEIENIIEVILFRSLWAVKFLKIIYLIEFFSQNKKMYVNIISMKRCKLNASNDKPYSIAIRIAKKIYRIRAKLNESNANGKK